MCDQSSLENINDTSETESEEWDLIQHKDVQISENTSDAESVEIISEEEAAQHANIEHISTDNHDPNDCLEFPNGNLLSEASCSNESPNDDRKENTEIVSSEIRPAATSSTACMNRELFSLYFPISERINSVLAEPKEAIFICLTIFIVGLATLIAPDDSRYNKGPTSLQNEQEINIGTLLKELEMYRESNENLKQQVKDLSEVVNGLQKSTHESSLNQDDPFITTKKPGQYPSMQNTVPYFGENFVSVMEIINFYKELTFLYNDTLLDNNTSTKFQNSSLNDIFSTLYNESIQTTLELFYKIPSHLKQLTMVVTQHKNIEPFISKWGNKLNKFSKSMDNDIRKMKLKFAKHLIRNINEMMYSFYRKLCRFELNKVITVQECDTFDFNKSWKNNNEINKKGNTDKKSFEKVMKNSKSFVYNNKNNDRKYFKQFKYFERNKKLNTNEEERMTEQYENESDIIADDSNEEFDSNYAKEKILKSYEEVNGKMKKKEVMPDNKKESLRKISENMEGTENILDNKNRENKNGNNRKRRSMNNSEYINNKHYQTDSYLCKKGYLLRCNNTDKSNNIDSNWFLDMGNQRSKIRSHQSKGDWIFDRARARREKNFHENHKQFYRKHSIPPSYF